MTESTEGPHVMVEITRGPLINEEAFKEAIERACKPGGMLNPQLFTLMPYAADMNLGRAYNESMALLPDGAWACFLDHDAIWTTREWYRQLQEAIAFYPAAGAIVAVANRIGPAWQRAGNPKNHDIAYHRAFGAERAKTHRTLLDVTETKGFGGVAFAISKAAWKTVGGFKDGMLCVDHGMHFSLREEGYRILVLESLYVYHWRRAFGDELPDETPRVEGCPCRGPEPTPTERIALP